MPIESAYQPANLTSQQFDERDRIVMGCAFASQNELGCSLEEHNYEKDLVARLKAEGFRDVQTQVHINVRHHDFHANYRIDLIADDAIYELKAVSGLMPEHDAQLLHYAMLLDINHCKLINFGPRRVSGRLLFNAVPKKDRFDFKTDTRSFQPQSSTCSELPIYVDAILTDWGAYLDFHLYFKAIVHHFGGVENVERRVPLVRNGVSIGDSRFFSLEPGVCFTVSGGRNREQLKTQHVKRLRLSPFRAMHCIHFGHGMVSL